MWRRPKKQVCFPYVRILAVDDLVVGYLSVCSCFLLASVFFFLISNFHMCVCEHAVVISTLKKRHPVELKVNEAKTSEAACSSEPHHNNNNNNNNSYTNNNDNQGNNNPGAHLDINTNHSHLEDNNNNQAHLECLLSTEASTAFGVGWCLT